MIDVRLGLVIKHSQIHTNIWLIKQNQTFDSQTVDNPTKSNVHVLSGQWLCSVKCMVTKLLFVWFLRNLDINTDQKWSNQNKKMPEY